MPTGPWWPEAIQTILRRENYPQPYEALERTHPGKNRIDKQSIHRFIGRLKIPGLLKKELKKITPHSYTGIWAVTGEKTAKY